ncbi:hypothetical protein K492DRAFT_210839 [Lichtheimia hyalospora FSU 10163]|nr:hypothetical protein K492DRAFT_210839 [Lichtheimia hyalospora FSU 10163]
MDVPLPSLVVRNDHCKSSVYMERCSSASPPPPYDDAVREDAWPATIDQTLMHMEKAVENTQDMLQRMKGNLSHFHHTSQALIDNLERSTRDGEHNESDNESDNDDLGRISQSLQQLIEQAQTSLKTRMAIRDPTCMTVHRSVSCPQLTTVFDEQQHPRRQSTPDELEEDTRRRSLARASTLFNESPSFRDQQKRYLDSHWRLTTAMQELVDTVNTCQQDKPCSVSQNHSLQHYQYPTPQRRRTLRKTKQVQHIHHHHYYHSSPQVIVQQQHYPPPPASISISHLFNHVWSSFRSSLVQHASQHRRRSKSLQQRHIHPSSVTAKSDRKTSTIDKQQQADSSLHSSKDQQSSSPITLPLAQSNLLRLMLFATLLLFSFMHPTTEKMRSKKVVVSQRCVGQFINTSAERLPVSTWIQRSCLAVYILAFL